MSTIAASDATALQVREHRLGPFALRLLSAAVMGPVVLAAIYVGGWPFTALIAAAVLVMSIEWTQLTGGGDVTARLVPAGALLAGVLAAGVGYPTIATIALLAIAGLLAGLELLRPTGRPWPALGLLWFGLPCIGLLWLRGLPEIGFSVVLWLFLLVWASDTVAYAFGRTIGGPRLAPRISPKKTWSGLAGAIIGPAIVGGAMAQLAEWPSVLGAVILSGILGAVGQAGDLAESAVKRRFAVKDSGTLIPGHGGLLDRVDALLCVALSVAVLSLIDIGAYLPWS